MHRSTRHLVCWLAFLAMSGCTSKSDDSGAPDCASPSTLYVDADGDGHGVPEDPYEGCERPSGYADTPDDCDDDDPSLSPSEHEVCDQIDNDCDGLVDDEDDSLLGAAVAYRDDDEDGFGEEPGFVVCVLPAEFVELGGDCDDDDEGVFPGADETCLTEFDDNCDGDLNDQEKDAPGCIDYFYDGDEDGVGTDAPTAPAPRCYCVATDNYSSLRPDDCDDEAVEINPDALEVCGNNVDENCDVAQPTCEIKGTISLGDADVEIAVEDLYHFGLGIGLTTLTSTGQLVMSTPSDPGYDAIYVFDAPFDGILGTTDADAVLTHAWSDRMLGTSLASADLIGSNDDDLLVATMGSADEVGLVAGPLGSGSVNGFSINGEAGFADTLAPAGDVDGDGVGDILVGSPLLENEGRATLYLGPFTSDRSDDDADLTILGVGSSARDLGASLAATDLDGDGRSDLIVGAPFGQGLVASSGAVFVVLGTASPSDLSAPSGIDFLLRGAAGGDEFGAAVGSGDLDGDGDDTDLWVGAPGSNEVYLFLAPEGDTNPTQAEEILAPVDSATNFGATGSLSGDLNGDALPDLIIGDPGFAASMGRAHVYFLPTTGASNATLVGQTIGHGAGTSVTTFDTNGNGEYADLYIAAPANGGGVVYGLRGGP